MNTFLNGMKTASNYTRTENGALTHKSTMDGLMDLFAMGAAYRSRTDEDVMLLFKNAFDENPVYALKCLFYIRDVRGGQGERRFFRVATKYPHIAKDYFVKQKHQTVELIKLNGSIELAPIVGLSDVIVDIVETGSTLKENGLVVLEDVCPLSARVVVNRVSMKMEQERITDLITKIRAIV